MRFYLLFLAFVAFNFQLLAQFSPNNGVKDSEAEIIALKNVTIYISPSKRLEKATVIISKGKIVEVERNASIPKGAVVYEMDGKTIVPSFIELYANVGLPKNGENNFSIHPKIDNSKKNAYYWNESIHPELEASKFYNSDSKVNENYIKSGFGFALTHFQDGISRGSGALVSLGNSTDKSPILNANTATFYSFSKGSANESYPSSQMGSIALLRQAFYDLKYYSENEVDEAAVSLEKWKQSLVLPSFFKTDDKWEILRAAKIATEFSQKFNYIGSGNEYLATKELKKLNSPLVIPINFPEAFEVKDPYIARQIPLSDLKHWELAPSNPAILKKAGINFCISSNGLKSPESFWKNLQKAISRGLSKEDALAALTTNPAKIIGMEKEIGDLENGKWASFAVYTNDPFEGDATLLEMWHLGEQKVLKELPTTTILGKYSVNIDGNKYHIEVTGTNEKPAGKIQTVKTKFDPKTKQTKRDTIVQTVYVALHQNDVTFQFICDDENFKGSINLHGKVSHNGGIIEGDGAMPNGKWLQWSAIRMDKTEEKSENSKIKVDSSFKAKVWFPNMAYGMDTIPEVRTVVFKNATVWTNESEGIIENATVVTENGKIKAVGKGNVNIPSKAIIIDAKGKHVTSGIIDEHSHIAISKGVNEGGQAVSAEVSIGDVVNPDDINIYRQLSGGVTAAQLLHGSANPIGGQSALIKLKWGHSPEEMLIPNAPKFIKCALGENVKQSNWGDYNSSRFPQTRMGVEQVFYDGFTRAKAYQDEWLKYSTGVTSSGKMPRKDLELEVLSEILDAKRFITCHSYVQSEINMLMHVADSMHFKINTFTHILEGYKVADKMKAHGVGGSTFADWWAYKFEVNDAIPYNANLMSEQGVVVAINSDDAEMGRRLNQEAAKSVKYGGMSEEDAWKMVTLNPAKLLHLDSRMGSLKVGKDADIVLWSDNPLSIDSKVEMTIVDGKILYNRADAAKLEARNAAEKARIISKMLDSNEKGEATKPFFKKRRRHFHCDTLGEEGTESENEH